MKKVLLISIVVTLVVLTGCIYAPATYVPTVKEQAALDIFANDTSATLDTVSCVILEAVNADWKKSYIDTVDDFLSLETDTMGTTIAEALDAAEIIPGNTDKIRIDVNGSFLGSYAKLTIAQTGEYDIYIDIHGAITVWDANSDIVEYDVYGMSTACAMVFKGDTRNSLIREHYTYSLDAGTYYIRFKKAENAAYKSKNYFFGIVN